MNRRNQITGVSRRRWKRPPLTYVGREKRKTLLGEEISWSFVNEVLKKSPSLRKDFVENGPEGKKGSARRDLQKWVPEEELRSQERGGGIRRVSRREGGLDPTCIIFIVTGKKGGRRDSTVGKRRGKGGGLTSIHHRGKGRRGKHNVGVRGDKKGRQIFVKKRGGRNNPWAVGSSTERGS